MAAPVPPPRFLADSVTFKAAVDQLRGEIDDVEASVLPFGTSKELPITQGIAVGNRRYNLGTGSVSVDVVDYWYCSATGATGMNDTWIPKP